MSQFKHTPEQARKLWVEALLSGEFKQCTEALCEIEDDKPVGFCCLGVACEIFSARESPLSTEVRRHGLKFVRHYDNEDMILPQAVRNWLGLATCGAVYGGQGSNSGQLAEDNDNGKSFPEIAAIIESAPPGLFESPRITRER